MWCRWCRCWWLLLLLLLLSSGWRVSDVAALEKVEAKVWPRNYATHASLPYAIDALAYATHAARDTTRAVG